MKNFYGLRKSLTAISTRFVPASAITVILFLSSLNAYSQDYKTGIGIRLSPSFHCITVKHFFGGKVAVEGLLNIVQTQVTIVGLAEFSNELGGQEGLKWYYGIGAALRLPQHSVFVVSIDGIIGLEYTFPEVPINLSLDWKPAVEIINGNNFYPAGFGLAVRFVFK